MLKGVESVHDGGGEDGHCYISSWLKKYLQQRMESSKRENLR